MFDLTRLGMLAIQIPMEALNEAVKRQVGWLHREVAAPPTAPARV